MKTMINKVHLEGKLYQHNLTLKKTGANSKNPGTEFISGTIDIATNDALTNIVSVHYTYVVATYPAKNGKPERPNPNFDILADIIAGKYTTVMGSGADSATKISVDSNIGVNDFYTDRQLDEKGEPTLVTAKRNEGGFIHIINALRTDENRRNTFETDILITGFSIKEADEENGYPEKGIIKGAVFDFRNSLLPVELLFSTLRQLHILKVLSLPQRILYSQEFLVMKCLKWLRRQSQQKVLLVMKLERLSLIGRTSL